MFVSVILFLISILILQFITPVVVSYNPISPKVKTFNRMLEFLTVGSALLTGDGYSNINNSWWLFTFNELVPLRVNAENTGVGPDGLLEICPPDRFPLNRLLSCVIDWIIVFIIIIMITKVVSLPKMINLIVFYHLGVMKVGIIIIIIIIIIIVVVIIIIIILYYII